jgi:hypothetical protein
LSEEEKAHAIKRLMEMKGWNEFLVTKNLGINDRYLRTLLSLLEAPKEIKEIVTTK